MISVVIPSTSGLPLVSCKSDDIIIVTNGQLQALECSHTSKANLYIWLSEQKPDMFTCNLKFILLPQLIATLNNYAYSLPPLANVSQSVFPEGCL